VAGGKKRETITATIHAYSPIFGARDLSQKRGTHFHNQYCPGDGRRCCVMDLDVNTLFMVTIYVESILGLLLLFVWVQNTAITAVAWWGFAHLIRASSVVLFGMYGSVPDLVSIDLANALLFTSFAVIWTGARLFDGKPVEPVYLVTGAVLWLLVCRLPGVAESVEVRVFVTSGIITVYTWLTAYEFWRGRSEALVSRWPAIFMLFAHGALFLLRTPLISALPFTPNNEVYGSVWLTVISFEALLFTISIAFILLAMAKERTELRHRTAAMLDPLTGMSNRRAFLEDAAAIGKRHAANPKPAAVLLIDLDHFKSINDRFGHAIGDRVLEVFAETAQNTLRSTDLVGRMGGEEFAAVLCEATHERAAAIAERLRLAFAQACQEIDGYPVGATLSVGMVHCETPLVDVTTLLAQADQALYFAKERGRNRVEIASLDLVRQRRDEPAAKPAQAAAKSAA
jgi:diguanylate cyclase (GGDEF)-like protein